MSLSAQIVVDAAKPPGARRRNGRDATAAIRSRNVSHNMAAIQRLCTSAILLQHGKLVRAGDIRSIVAAYLGGEARGGFAASARTGDAQVLSADLEDAAGRPLDNPACTEPIVCRMRFTLPHRSPGTKIGI